MRQEPYPQSRHLPSVTPRVRSYPREGSLLGKHVKLRGFSCSCLGVPLLPSNRRCVGYRVAIPKHRMAEFEMVDCCTLPFLGDLRQCGD